MKKRICIALLILLASGANAQSAPAEVMLFGVFHFANPGRDVIRTDQIDVTTPESQSYLDGLAERLAPFYWLLIKTDLSGWRDLPARAG